MNDWLLSLIEMALFVALAPLFSAWVKRVKCWLQNRRAPALLQPYRDLRRLFAKQVVLSHNASPIFRVTPYIIAGATLLAAAVVPFISVHLPTAAIADVIVLAGFFALARFFQALVGIAETGRIPVDNPATHLELTMIHEAMILEYSGRHLALIEWAAQLKLLIYGVLIVNIFFPWGIATHNSIHALAVASGVVFFKLLVLGVLLAIGETVLAKMRLFRVPAFLVLALTLALIGLLSHIILEVG